VATALTPEKHVIVIFGANGDLSRRKLLPSLYHLYREGMMPEDFRIIGSSRSEISDEEFIDLVRDSVLKHGRCKLDEGWDPFAARLSYAPTAFGSDHTAEVEEDVYRAEKELGGVARRLFYLSVPPSAFPEITQGLAKSGLSESARVVFEKPFGSDLASFQELDAVVRGSLDDDQVYRIDHFIGKETVQNILALRFANGMFEPIWNRQHIDHVQIDVPETLGIGTRAGFYEGVGAMRDMIVTHLFQVLSFIALEPPASFTPKSLMDEVAKVFESMASIDAGRVVYGQYRGYLEEEGVAQDSNTETFAAVEVSVDNWRWAGVPFYLRTGKRLAESRQLVTLAFRAPPRQMFRDVRSRSFDHDHLAIDLGSDEGIRLSFLAKAPGPSIELDQAHMDFRYRGSFGSDLIGPYERLIHDALIGDRTLFTRADGIEQTWEIVQPVLETHDTVYEYEPGSWGPEEANQLIAPRRWYLPE
jgi:glucose-6-phosphate 1-dehydrogenase